MNRFQRVRCVANVGSRRAATVRYYWGGNSNHEPLGTALLLVPHERAAPHRVPDDRQATRYHERRNCSRQHPEHQRCCRVVSVRVQNYQILLTGIRVVVS